MNEVWPRIYVWPKANRLNFPGKQKGNLTTERPKITTGGAGVSWRQSLFFEAAASAETLPRTSGPLTLRPGLSGQLRANRQSGKNQNQTKTEKKQGNRAAKKTLDKLNWRCLSFIALSARFLLHWNFQSLGLSSEGKFFRSTTRTHSHGQGLWPAESCFGIFSSAPLLFSSAFPWAWASVSASVSVRYPCWILTFLPLPSSLAKLIF